MHGWGGWGLDRVSSFRWGLLGKRGDLKNSLKTKMFFSAITKNLNWQVLTKNLVTFKRWDGVKDDKFQYYGSSLKNHIFKRCHKKPIYRGRIA